MRDSNSRVYDPTLQRYNFTIASSLVRLSKRASKRQTFFFVLRLKRNKPKTAQDIHYDLYVYVNYFSSIKNLVAKFEN